MCLNFKSFKVFELQKWLKFDNFANIADKTAKSKYFANIQNQSDSPINSFSNNVYFVGVSSSFKNYRGRRGAFCKSVYVYDRYSMYGSILYSLLFINLCKCLSLPVLIISPQNLSLYNYVSLFSILWTICLGSRSHPLTI